MLKKKEIFEEMLFYQKKAFAFNFTHQRKVKSEVLSLQIIKTIKYKA